MIETSQLQTLVAVADIKSFSKAAEQLNVTQSAISQSIKNLEIKVGVKLFKRSGKKVVLTSEGEKLYSLASGFLSNMDNVLSEILHDKDSMSGKVRIGTLAGIGKSWLTPTVLELVKGNSDLTVNVTLGFCDDLIREFENYKLDILILPEQVLPNIGEKISLGEERVTLVFPEDNKFKVDKSIDLNTLASYPTILFEQNDSLYSNWCRKHFGKVPKKRNIRYSVNSHGNMLQAVQKGVGVAVVPTHVLRRSYYKDKVCTLGEEFEVSNGVFYLCFHKDSEELARISNTIKHITSSTSPLS